MDSEKRDGKNWIKTSIQINWVNCICIVICVFVILSMYVNFPILYYSAPCPSGRTGRISLSVETTENTWDIAVEEIKMGKTSLASIASEDIILSIYPSDHTEDSSFEERVDIRLDDIRNKWCQDYGIQWDDVENDGELSVGDKILIDRDGGEERRFLPGSRIRIHGRAEDFRYSGRIEELPDDETNSIYTGSEQKAAGDFEI